MKRMISMLMILALLLGSVAAFAQDDALSAAQMENAEAAENFEEEVQEIFDLYGEILEITDEYVLINTADLGHVQVNLSEDTVIDGVETLEVGQTAVVMYNGMVTRSLPPQVTAMHIGVYAVKGEIVEVLEDSLVIVQDETGEQIILTLPIIDAAGENEELLKDEAFAAEETADEAEAEMTDEAADETEASEEAAADEQDEAAQENATDEIAEPAYQAGDRIIAYTTGAMTMSLPPQMNALAIVFDIDETAAEETEETEKSEETEESEESIG